MLNQFKTRVANVRKLLEFIAFGKVAPALKPPITQEKD